jgi:mannose-6-phosphate isomerase-like protein (cupin superfamily)
MMPPVSDKKTATGTFREQRLLQRSLADFASERNMPLTRREICALLPALLPLAAQMPAHADESVLPSGAFQFDQLPLHVANNNAQIRMIMRGKLATGEGIEVHETTLPPGGAPTATTHHHRHSEMWLVRAGNIELTVNGKTYSLSAGSLGFARSNDEHGIRNSGSTPATYFLIAVGPGAELQT